MGNGMAQDLTALSPPVAISGLVVGGVELNDVVLILTIIYTALLIIKSIPQVCRIMKEFIVSVRGKKRRKDD